MKSECGLQWMNVGSGTGDQKKADQMQEEEGEIEEERWTKRRRRKGRRGEKGEKGEVKKDDEERERSGEERGGEREERR
jgi:hypothetical protein